MPASPWPNYTTRRLVPFKTACEKWNSFSIGNGFVLRAKYVLSNVVRFEDGFGWGASTITNVIVPSQFIQTGETPPKPIPFKPNVPISVSPLQRISNTYLLDDAESLKVNVGLAISKVIYSGSKDATGQPEFRVESRPISTIEPNTGSTGTCPEERTLPSGAGEGTIRFQTLNESWYRYRLGDGAIIRIKQVLVEIKRLKGVAPAVKAESIVGFDNLPQSGMGPPGETTYSPMVLEAQTGSPLRFSIEERGGSSYRLENGKTVSYQLSLRDVRPTSLFDPLGLPIYRPHVIWIPEPPIWEEPEFQKKRPPIAQPKLSSLQLLTAEKSLLEWLFPANWFIQTREKQHPAVARWRLLNELIAQNGIIKLPAQENVLREIGRINMDSATLVLAFGGTLNTLTPGSFEKLGDTKFISKITSRIADPRQYEDLMVELYAAAWHISAKHTVKGLEEEGMPDIMLAMESCDFPVYLECKHITSMTKNKIPKLIKDANVKFRRTETNSGLGVYGVVLLDVTDSIGDATGIPEDLPSSISEILVDAQHAVSGDKNHRIRTVLVVWDDFQTRGELPQPKLIAFRRNVKVVNHSSQQITVSPDQLFQGFTSAAFISMTPD